MSPTPAIPPPEADASAAPSQEPLLKTRLFIALGLVTYAAYHYWALAGKLQVITTACLCTAGLMVPGKTLLTQKLSQRDLLLFLLGVAGTALFLYLKLSSPSDILEEKEKLKHYTQARFIVPAWAIVCALIVGRYYRSRSSRS